MAIKKKATKKVADRGVTRKAPAPKVKLRFNPKPRHALRPDPPKIVPKPRPVSAPESKEVLAKGYEWYDDGGNEGPKQRPISEEGGTHG